MGVTTSLQYVVLGPRLFQTDVMYRMNPMIYRLLKKYQQFSHMGPWSASYDPGEVTFAKRIMKTLDKWKRPLFLLNIFKNFFMHVYRITSLVHLEYI